MCTLQKLKDRHEALTQLLESHATINYFQPQNFSSDVQQSKAPHAKSALAVASASQQSRIGESPSTTSLITSSTIESSDDAQQTGSSVPLTHVENKKVCSSNDLHQLLNERIEKAERDLKAAKREAASHFHLAEDAELNVSHITYLAYA